MKANNITRLTIVLVLIICLTPLCTSQSFIEWQVGGIIKFDEIEFEIKEQIGFFAYERMAYLQDDKGVRTIAINNSKNEIIVVEQGLVIYRNSFRMFKVNLLSDKKRNFLLFKLGRHGDDFVYTELTNKHQETPKSILTDEKEKLSIKCVVERAENVVLKDVFQPFSILKPVSFEGVIPINKNPNIRPPEKRFSRFLNNILSSIDGIWYCTDGYQFYLRSDPAAERYWHPKMKGLYPSINSKPYKHLRYRIDDTVIDGNDCVQLICLGNDRDCFPDYNFCEGSVFYDDIDGLKIIKGKIRETNELIYFFSDGIYKSKYNFTDAARISLGAYLDKIMQSNDTGIDDFDNSMRDYAPVLKVIMGEKEYLELYAYLKTGLVLNQEISSTENTTMLYRNDLEDKIAQKGRYLMDDSRILFSRGWKELSSRPCVDVENRIRFTREIIVEVYDNSKMYDMKKTSSIFKIKHIQTCETNRFRLEKSSLTPPEMLKFEGYFESFSQALKAALD